MEFVDCNLCGSNDFQVIHKIDVNDKTLKFFRHSRNALSDSGLMGIFNIVKCNNCSFVYTNPRLTSKQLDELYSSNKILGGNWRNFPYLFDKNQPDELQDLSNSAIKYDTLESWKERIFRKYAPNYVGMKMLDIGCGAGKFVRQCLDLGIDAYGIDLSKDRIEYGIKEYSLEGRIWQGTLIEEQNKHIKYDIITLWDVIEHVPNPKEILNEIRKIISIDSKLFILTMSLDSFTYKLYRSRWFYIHPPQHLSYFSHKTMEKMLRSEGYKLEGIEMDHTRDKNVIHLAYRVLIGAINHLLFKIWRNNMWYIYWFFWPITKGVSRQRILKRFENIQPSLCAGRYKDNFVFVASRREP